MLVRMLDYCRLLHLRIAPPCVLDGVICNSIPNCFQACQAIARMGLPMYGLLQPAFKELTSSRAIGHEKDPGL